MFSDTFFVFSTWWFAKFLVFIFFNFQKGKKIFTDFYFYFFIFSGPKGQAIDYQIAVLPSLPQLDCIITQKSGGRLQGQGSDSNPGQPLNQDEMIKMYLGESASFECVLTNVSGNIKTDGAKISISTHPYYLQDMITLNDSEISENTPMEPGESKSFSIDICALKLLVNTPVFSTLDRDQQVDLEQGGPSSISSTISRTEPSRWSGRSEGNAPNLSQQPSSKSSSAKRPNFVMFEIKISYSGGQGGEKGHCRHLIRQLKVDIAHSALVSKWDILPSEVPHENYLVLDISNQSIHEMEIEYGPARKMIRYSYLFTICFLVKSQSAVLLIT